MLYLESEVSSDCRFELMEHRKLLLRNHKLSPEVVSMCSNDIEKYCHDIEIGRRTIHCLMDHSKPSRQKNRIGKSCQKAVNCNCLTIDKLLFVIKKKPIY